MQSYDRDVIYERPITDVTHHRAVMNELLFDDQGGCSDDDVALGVHDHGRVVRPVAILHGKETL